MAWADFAAAAPFRAARVAEAAAGGVGAPERAAEAADDPGAGSDACVLDADEPPTEESGWEFEPEPDAETAGVLTVGV